MTERQHTRHHGSVRLFVIDLLDDALEYLREASWRKSS